MSYSVTHKWQISYHTFILISLDRGLTMTITTWPPAIFRQANKQQDTEVVYCYTSTLYLLHLLLLFRFAHLTNRANAGLQTALSYQASPPENFYKFVQLCIKLDNRAKLLCPHAPHSLASNSPTVAASTPKPAATSTAVGTGGPQVPWISRTPTEPLATEAQIRMPSASTVVRCWTLARRMPSCCLQQESQYCYHCSSSGNPCPYCSCGSSL